VGMARAERKGRFEWRLTQERERNREATRF
jgi:hypothetical protein